MGTYFQITKESSKYDLYIFERSSNYSLELSVCHDQVEMDVETFTLQRNVGVLTLNNIKKALLEKTRCLFVVYDMEQKLRSWELYWEHGLPLLRLYYWDWEMSKEEIILNLDPHFERTLDNLINDHKIK